MYKFAGHTKFVAYAPIKFFSGNYPAPAGFGWVGMGLDVEKYNELAVKTSQRIEKEAKSWTTTIILILALSVILLFLILALLARGITRSIEAEVPAEAQEAAKLYDDDDEDDR
jgi:amino acid permease